MCGFVGSNLFAQTALHSVSVPASLTLQDRIYWTDLEDEAIYSANRLTGHDVAKVAQHLNNPLDLVVFHEQKQPKGEPEEMSIRSVLFCCFKHQLVVIMTSPITN